MLEITASIVLYKTQPYQISRLLNCLNGSGIFTKILIIDNSPEPINFNFLELKFVQYVKSDNHGYGAGHNIALQNVLETSNYHFILNPDIYFDPLVISLLISRMQQDSNVGLLMPKILYPNGDIQFLCKLLPSPLDLFIRRFPIPFLRNVIEKNNFKYELKFTGYSHEMNVPALSGCFMLLNINAINDVGMFDPRYFMYAEDIDLSRRIHSLYKTIFYPEAIVFHEHAQDSYKNIRMLFLHISSVIKYFNKWGWFFDVDRRKVNRLTLELLRK